MFDGVGETLWSSGWIIINPLQKIQLRPRFGKC